MKKIFLLFAFFLIVSVASAEQIAEQIAGRVVGVHDGDTLTLLTDAKQQIKVRLAEIDTPESRQPYGTRSKQALSDLAFGKQARIEVADRDRYGRTVARVYVGSTDVNAALVEQGAAWVYRQYSHDPRLLDLERQAQAAKRGLWAQPEADRMPPWEWRHARKAGNLGSTAGAAAMPPRAQPQVQIQAANSSGSACAGKRYCKEMSDCAEARHYLNDCGLRSLDGDSDGTPCESLCR